MLGGLLKQLVVALGRFGRFHATRIFQRKEPIDPGAPTRRVESIPVEQSNEVSSDLGGLDARYLQTHRWASRREDSVPDDLAADPLYQLWTATSGGHKWTQYFAVYRELFASLTSRPMRILEIGVLNGAGLRLWRNYFSHPDTIVVGIDILPGCAQFESIGEGIHVRIGSQADPKFLHLVVKEFGPFDLIIDDGSHRSSHMITSFNSLFADGLNDSGIYFVEDLHANYWPAWRDTRQSFLDLCKELVEHMHAHYRQGSPESFLVAKPSHQPKALDVPIVTTMIREIRFFDSMVAIYKTRRQYLPFYLLGS
jgi:hypothetical protein